MTRQALFLSILAALLLIVAWWFLLFSPAQDELALVEEDIEAVEGQISVADAEIVALEEIRANAAQVQSEITSAAAVVPDDPGLPALLRQVQAAADDSGVVLTNLAPARPVEVPEAGTSEPLAAINLTMNADGSYFQLVDFLRRLADPELVARGLLVQDVNAAIGDEYPTLNVAITAQAFATIDAPPALPSEDDEEADVDVDVDADVDVEETDGESPEPESESDDATEEEAS